MNKHVGSIIEGNNEKVSMGGKLIMDFLDKQNYVLVNSSKKVEGGPFTRVEPSDPENDTKKSCIDLIILSKDLYKYIDRVTIQVNKIGYCCIVTSALLFSSIT